MVKESHYRNAPPELRSRLLDALRSHRRRRSHRLEVYLRALWVLARGHASAEPRWDQIGEWLVTALTARPALFDEAWLRFRDPPEAGEGTPREEFDATLLFQIADLRRMQGGALEDEWGDFGVDSPTGNSWYNFEPLSYLECALAGISANNVDGHSLTPGWRPFAWFLELGRIYE